MSEGQRETSLRGRRGATALLVGGFGLQFAVTNPLMADRVFGLGRVAFGVFGTFLAVGGVAGELLLLAPSRPGHREFRVWTLTFGIAECLAALPR